MSHAEKLALASSGSFLMAGLLAGIWKYQQIMTREEHRASVYVDVAHRAALLYSFACLVMMKLVEYSPYATSTQLIATGVPIFFFAVAVASYVWHGARGLTDNQFEQRNVFTTWGMGLLIAGEVGGVAILLWGFLVTQVW